MKCPDCRKNMIKVDRRNEMAELDDEATDGQMADYFAAELSGDNGAWNMGIVEYLCSSCELYHQLVSDDLPSYEPLIKNWHAKARSGDYFSKFVFEYLAFIAHVKNNLFYSVTRDRETIQLLKGETGLQKIYLKRVKDDPDLKEAWSILIKELHKRPLHNSSHDLDHPEIDVWWNNAGVKPNTEDDTPKGVIHSLEDWSNMVEFWYSVRNNLFHGGKNPSVERDLLLVKHAYHTLRPFMDIALAMIR